MRRVRGAVVVLALSLMSLAFAAGPAAAGGPTSVLLVRADTEKAASLYYTDADYALLSELVGANSPRGLSGRLDSSGAGHELGSGVTLTWLVHDAAVWRVDRVYLDAESGPWVATQLVGDGAGSVYDSPTVWHTVTDGGALRGLFERVGLGAGPEAAVGGGRAPNVATGDLATVTPALPQKTSRPASPTPTWGGWAWGLAGLALGVLLAVASPRVLSRTRRVPAAPLDTEAAEDGSTPVRDAQPDPDDGSAWTPADELSWSGGPRG
jgi:hypothetical protein